MAAQDEARAGFHLGGFVPLALGARTIAGPRAKITTTSARLRASAIILYRLAVINGDGGLSPGSSRRNRRNADESGADTVPLDDGAAGLARHFNLVHLSVRRGSLGRGRPGLVERVVVGDGDEIDSGQGLLNAGGGTWRDEALLKLASALL